MSRTYKKGYTSHLRGDKESRKLYHRAARRKTKNLLKEERYDDIITANIDRSIHEADQWDWPSDGRAGRFQDDYVTLRRAFNKAVFGKEEYRRWCRNRDETTAWTEYCKYRDAAANSIPQVWELFYKVPDGTRLVTTLDLIYDSKIELHHYVYNTHPEMQYKQVKKVLDHHPYISDVPSDAIEIRVYRQNKWKFTQANNDWFLIEFLFHRGMIPHNFQTADELVSWLMKNEERIIHSWYKVLYTK